MTAYAIAHLREVEIGPEIVEYLRKIDDTLEPFDGRFLVHGTMPEPKDGSWQGSVVVISFPTIEKARGWYDSPAYQAILPLRTEHSDGDAVIVEGVGAGYRAEHLAATFAAT